MRALTAFAFFILREFPSKHYFLTFFLISVIHIYLLPPIFTLDAPSSVIYNLCGGKFDAKYVSEPHPTQIKMSQVVSKRIRQSN